MAEAIGRRDFLGATALRGPLGRPNISTQEGSAGLGVCSGLTIDATDWGGVIQADGASAALGPGPRTRYVKPNASVDPIGYLLTDMNPVKYALVITETDDGRPTPNPEHFDDRKFYLMSDTAREDYLALNWPLPPHRPVHPARTPLTWTFYQVEYGVYSQRRLVDNYNLRIARSGVVSLVWTAIAPAPQKVGVWNAKKIADLADARYDNLALHNVGDPIDTVASAHLVASIPKSLALECRVAAFLFFDDLLETGPLIEKGRIAMNDRPGWGVEFDQEVACRYRNHGFFE